MTTLSTLKARSWGFLIGRLVIFCYKVIEALGDNPAYEELVKEADGLIKRWEVEKKIKSNMSLT